MKSPCIRQCGLNEFNFCEACGMTVRDLRTWGSADDQRKEEIISESRIRTSSVQAMRNKGVRDDE